VSVIFMAFCPSFVLTKLNCFYDTKLLLKMVSVIGLRP
jgi:hypothetical protein